MRTWTVIPFFFALACQSEVATPGAIDTSGEVVVTIDGQPIHRELLDSISERLPPEQQAAFERDPNAWRGFVENVAVGQSLYHRALAEGLQDDPDVRRMVAVAVREVLAGEMVERHAESKVNDDAIRERYEAQKVQYAAPQAKARHILLEDEAAANAAITRIKGGEDFADVAKAESKDTHSGAEGGSLGWLSKGRTLPAFEERIFTAEGETGLLDPFETPYGWHIVDVQERRHVIPLEDVRDEIAGQLKRDAVQAFLTEARESAEISWPGGEPVPAVNPEADAHAGHNH